MNETLFKEVIAKWLKEKEKYVKISTYAYYCYELKNYILPQLGDIPVSKITEKELQKVVLYWQISGSKKKKPMKKSTIQNLLMLTKQCLKYAAGEGYSVEYNLHVRFMPVQIEQKQKVFTRQEQQELIQAILSHLSYKSFGILLCLNSGLRIGEVCALQWKDIDLENSIIHITKTLQRIYQVSGKPYTKIVISSPKTESSIRNIPISAKMVNIIQNLEKRNETGYVLTNTERCMEPRTFRKFYMEFLDRHGIKKLNFHCLRHTFATCCIAKGADYKSVSEILGHSSINTTLNMYVHPLEEEKRKCIELVF